MKIVQKENVQYRIEDEKLEKYIADGFVEIKQKAPAKKENKE